ncbi:MAG: hypothetical protein E4H40_00625, partial [Candidatus Brocadiia bacterium]
MGRETSVVLTVVVLITLLLTGTLVQTAVGAEKDYFPSFTDENTVGLWLFDETDYPYTNITDASQYEYDLRLMKGGKLVNGRYGRALKVTPGLDYAIGYSSWKGYVAFGSMRETSGRPGSGLWGPTVAPEKLLNALNGHDFTCELWVMLMSYPIQDVVLIDLGDKYNPGFKLTLQNKAAGFVVENAYVGFKATCPATLAHIWGRAWHHIAFTYSAANKKLEYFIDGKSQGSVPVSVAEKTSVPPSVWPESLSGTTYGIFQKANRNDVPDFEKRRNNRFNFSIGHDRHGEGDFDGCVDELRFSDVVRYTEDFARPDSFSRNYRKDAAKPAVANGPPLLFGLGKTYLPNDVVDLGSRKHVFIDDAMIAQKRNVSFNVNPLTEATETDMRNGGDTPIFDHDGKIWMFQMPHYGSGTGNIRLFISEDGIHFSTPDLGIIEDRNSKYKNVIITHTPCWGRFFKDTNPNVNPEELFKFTGWIAQRGIYLYLSPDGIHWRRNETCMLPLVSGGGCETFWDDQRGVYINLLKRDGSYNTGDYPAAGRGASLFETREVTKAWPFNEVANPYYEGWAFPAPTGEGIDVMGPDLFNTNDGHVFRTRARKYEWADDTYVAFLARNGHTELAVSRNGLTWHIYDGDNNLPFISSQFGGEAWIQDGLIRRGDEIWHYLNASNNKVLRFSQRLDGFVSIDAGESTGALITRPFVFKGGELTINANVKGSMKVAILNLAGRELHGFNMGLADAPKGDVRGYGLGQCDPIKGDSVRHVVKWKGSSDVSNLEGETVRLRIE